MAQNWRLARKRSTLEKRARIVQAIRAFFVAHDFLEVESPQRIPANAPERYIDAVPSADWFLQTSPELAMKRLLAAGYGNIFQISHCWRAGERGKQHLPEYTMLEWYRPDCDYQSMMDDCENLLNALAPASQLNYQGRTIDLTPPWPRLTVKEAFSDYTQTSLEEALAQDRFDEVISLEIEPKLPTDKPLFLLEYPVSQASLARVKPGDDSVAERFELYVGGIELANAFSELTDAEEQRCRFTIDEAARRFSGKTPYPTPEPFLNERSNLTSATGIALGIDRLIMLLTDCNDISETVAFTPEQL